MTEDGEQDEALRAFVEALRERVKQSQLAHYSTPYEWYGDARKALQAFDDQARRLAAVEELLARWEDMAARNITAAKAAAQELRAVLVRP